MQGIYKEFEITSFDVAWTCALDLVQDEQGKSNYEDAITLIIDSGCVFVWKF